MEQITSPIDEHVPPRRAEYAPSQVEHVSRRISYSFAKSKGVDMGQRTAEEAIDQMIEEIDGIEFRPHYMFCFTQYSSNACVSN